MYPALAVLNALQGKVDPVLWVGSETGMEADLIARTGLSYQAIPAAGVHGVGLRSLPGNLCQLARGYQSARPILRDFNPDVLLFTGGYVAVPMALAARTMAERPVCSGYRTGTGTQDTGTFCQSYRHHRRGNPANSCPGKSP